MENGSGINQLQRHTPSVWCMTEWVGSIELASKESNGTE